MKLTVQFSVNSFTRPVVSAITALGADPAKVVTKLNSLLADAEVIEEKCTGKLTFRHSKKDGCVVRQQDGRVAKLPVHPLTRLAEINQWSAEGAELYVGQVLTMPTQIAEHLASEAYKLAPVPTGQTQNA